jgi:hypothetical protein
MLSLILNLWTYIRVRELDDVGWEVDQFSGPSIKLVLQMFDGYQIWTARAG